MEQKKNNMATASMVLGILSIVLACCCFLGFMLGALAILFACLSKVDDHMEGKAKAGLTTGIIGILLGVASLIFWLVFLAGSSYGSGYSVDYGYVPAIQALVRGGLL